MGTWNVTTKGHGVELFDTVGSSTRARLEERLSAVETFLSG